MLLLLRAARWRPIQTDMKPATWKRLRYFPHFRSYSSPGFLEVKQGIEEETLPFYSPSNFYPAYIGEVFASKYRVVGKLGFGASSTVWLAWDLQFGV